MRFKQITIVGVGLIGGSFGLAARRAGLAEKITGCDEPLVLEQATSLGVIDAAEESFERDRTCDADLVYLAAPVGGILSFLRTRASLLKPGAIVTDAGSTKREICRSARESLPRTVSFVGGHPMAGSEKSGVRFANADLFSGAPYALISGDSVRADAISIVKELICSIEAIPIELSAEEHDRIVARVSHTPQLLAVALALAAARRKNSEGLKVAGSGFSDMTRLAESGWPVWEDICRTNADQIAAALDELIREIQDVQAAVASGDFAGLEEMFGAANELLRRCYDAKRRAREKSEVED